jgi:Flp pilus assembly protein TadD
VDRRLHAQLGEYLTGVGRTAEGISILEPLAAGNPEDPEILNALAIAYARTGESDKAAVALERLVAAMPGSSIPYENLGVLALSRNDIVGARQYFERALKITPESSRAFTGKGALAMHQGDRRAAYEAWGRAVTLDPDNYEALYNLGVNLARDGRKVEARPYLERFVKIAQPAFHADQLEVAAYLLR